MEQITNFKKSAEYSKKIHGLIPGGAHTYSKGDDQFPAMAPAAITHGKGCYVWDPDGNRYLDCSMGLTSVSLGHGYAPVVERVKIEIEKGVNFQRPSVLEMEAAEKFLALIPHHQMVKFTKNGSTATTAAVKLARAFTGRKYVAFPSDQPFFSYDDWFIGSTPCNKGIPGEVASLSLTFPSHDLPKLEELFVRYPGQIACVISEPEKSQGIPEGYLQRLIEICHRNGALFVMDEMITGFKTDLPGSQKKYKVIPDMATWGKGIANGFSLCALTGKREYMDLGGITRKGEEKVFLISTTHGGETGALGAAIATIEIFEKEHVISHNHALGRLLSAKTKELVRARGLEPYLNVIESEWLPCFVFKNKNKETSDGLRTLFLQEMIKRGVLFQGIFVPALSHEEKDISLFADAFSESLEIYMQALEKGYEKFLIGEPAKPVFRKYL